MRSYRIATSCFPVAISSVLVLGVLAGCAATKPTYQNNRKVIINEKGVPNYYRVKSGDTVSKIAERYGLNYRRIGSMNRLDSKYTIYSGQWLTLWQGNKKSNKYPTQKPPKNNSINPTITNTKYQYPSNNRIVQNYQSGVSNGLWYSGDIGDPVYASGTGTVIYAGNGLTEFGNLVMIRHTDDLITAYAHNSQMLVNEGTYVTRGQKIATMGSTGNTRQVGLQFQVRKKGFPVDPRSVIKN